MTFKNTRAYAQRLDSKDPLRDYRKRFYFPKKNKKKVIYFAGHSLGLQPKITDTYIKAVMKDWREMAVQAHFHAKKPWVNYHEQLSGILSGIVGSKPSELAVMNSLTVNLHLLMVSFYRPDARRHKILCEAKPFSSDRYMLQSQLAYHGFDPENSIIELTPKEGYALQTEAILAKIEEEKESLALVLMSGVNYYTGQVFDIKAISRAAQSFGIKTGWDLAHAAGNIKLELHDWNVDFAAWCSYKYMNSGPGNIAAAFVHEKHHRNTELKRFAGWWGHNKKRRFLMEPQFDPIPSAEAWQLSNPPILAIAPYLASLKMFEEAGMDALIAKRNIATDYLEFVLGEIDSELPGYFKIITPPKPERGCQISILLKKNGKWIFNYLIKKGVILDWREPNVIRLAPTPFYTSFEDICIFGQLLKKGILKSDTH